MDEAPLTPDGIRRLLAGRESTLFSTTEREQERRSVISQTPCRVCGTPLQPRIVADPRQTFGPEGVNYVGWCPICAQVRTP